MERTAEILYNRKIRGILPIKSNLLFEKKVDHTKIRMFHKNDKSKQKQSYKKHTKNLAILKKEMGS